MVKNETLLVGLSSYQNIYACFDAPFIIEVLLASFLPET
jgi:hypothetical protein